MTLDEQIKEAILDGAHSSDWQDRALLESEYWKMPLKFMVGNLKRLVKEVVEDVKPDKYIRQTEVVNTCLLKHPHNGACAGMGSEVAETVAEKQCGCIEEMERKAAELGL